MTWSFQNRDKNLTDADWEKKIKEISAIIPIKTSFTVTV